MVDLTETNTWETGVFRLETTTPALGGAGGPMNTQAQQLANRTTYLKDQVEDRLPLAGGTMTGAIVLPNDGSLPLHAASRRHASQMRLHNRLINPHYLIDSRGNGAGIAVASGGQAHWMVDRWAAVRLNGSPITVSRGYDTAKGFQFLRAQAGTPAALAGTDYILPFGQPIEGFNIADFGWGQAAAAKPITVSFPFRASVTGTYAVTVRNGGDTRNYVTTFAYGTANAWQDVVVTIPGEPSGTWDRTTGIGLTVFVAGVSGTTGHAAALNTWGTAGALSHSSATAWHMTSGATVDMGPAQLEIGVTSTDPEFRPIGVDYMLAQRYWQQATGLVLIRWTAGGTYGGGYLHRTLSVPMRASPSVTLFPVAGTWNDPSTGTTPDALNLWFNSGTTVGDYYQYYAYLNAELI